MSPARYRFYRKELDDLLWLAWDPIGVNGYEGAVGEYLSYSTKISDMIMNGSDAQAVFDYLRKIECIHIGLPDSDESRTRIVSEHALSIYRVANLIR